MKFVFPFSWELHSDELIFFRGVGFPLPVFDWTCLFQSHQSLQFMESESDQHFNHISKPLVVDHISKWIKYEPKWSTSGYKVIPLPREGGFFSTRRTSCWWAGLIAKIEWQRPRLLGGDWNMTSLFFHLLGRITPLDSLIFFRRVEITNQQKKPWKTMKNQAHQPQFGAASRRATKPERQTGKRELLHSAPLTASWVSVSPGVGTWEPFFFSEKTWRFFGVGRDGYLRKVWETRN